MTEPFPYRPADEPSTPVPARVQARLERLDPDVPGGANPEAPLEAPSPEGWVARDAAESRMDRFDQHLHRLRGQLDQVFDELEDRLAECEARVGVAEARASVAESRASVAETRAADAETRANEAHHRVDELLAELGRVLGTRLEGGSTSRPDLRGALEQLRDRLDVG